MKHFFILCILGLFTLLSLFSSCRKDTSPIIPVDSTTLKPEVKVSHKLLDSGWVQFYLNSNVAGGVYGWNSLWGSNDFEPNPKYWFKNGSARVRFAFRNKYGNYADTTIVFEVTNSVPQMDSRRFAKGIVFGDSIDLQFEINIQNTFTGWGLLLFDGHVAQVLLRRNHDTLRNSIIVLGDLNTIPGTDLPKLRTLLKPGPVPLARYKTVTHDNGNVAVIGRKTDGWSLFIEHRSSGRTEIAHAGTVLGDTLEILNVKEIEQIPVFPGLESTAFIATFHYKGNIWGQPISGSDVNPKIEGRDKIDLTFDVKFNMFPKWTF